MNSSSLPVTSGSAASVFLPAAGKQRWRKRTLLPCLLFTAFIGCTGFEAKAPAGFAPYEDASVFNPNGFRAITADGVRYRVRQALNEPEGDASLWIEAVRRSLTKKGYHVTDVKAMRTDDNREIHLIRSSANLGGRDYNYITAFCLNGKNIVLIEAGGTTPALQPREKDIEAALRSLKIR